MAISIDWLSRVIFVPQADLTPLGGGVYELDVNAFRLSLKSIEASEIGMPFPETHRHNTQVSLAGATYARTMEIINGYTVEFEDGQYTVVCSGANHNIGDVKVVNSVSLIIGNAAGLIVVAGGEGGGLTTQEHNQLMALPLLAEIVAGVWGATTRTLSTFGSLVADVWLSATRTLTQVVGLTTAEHDQLMGLENADLTALEAAVAGLVIDLGELQGDVDDLGVDLASIGGDITTIIGTVGELLGLTGKNTKWSALSFDARHNMTGATVTQYSDATLTSAVRSWRVTASYDADSELTAYQMVLL
jgi:hypothetical protein